MFERDYRDLAFVPRWAIAPVNRRQSVAEHSFYVAVYAIDILNFYKNKCKTPLPHPLIINTLVHATLHDRSEAFMSDIPGPVKRGISDKTTRKVYEHGMESKTYSLMYTAMPDAEKIIKVADLMDEWAYWEIETAMGNAFRGVSDLKVQIWDRLCQAIAELPHLTPDAKDQLLNMFVRGCSKLKTIPKNNDDLGGKK